MLPNQAERFISIPKKCLPDFRTKIRTSGRHSLHKNIVYIDKFHFRIKIDAFILNIKIRKEPLVKQAALWYSLLRKVDWMQYPIALCEK